MRPKGQLLYAALTRLLAFRREPMPRQGSPQRGDRHCLTLFRCFLAVRFQP